MKKGVTYQIIVCLLLINCHLFAQYQVGHKQITFNDPARSNRAIQTEIYYPANTSGDNVAIASGQFPVIVFGHGFVMVWSTYQNFWDSIVPMGYIMAFPRTEGSMSPNHESFGLDLRFLNMQFKTENLNSSSFFYQSIASNSAIMGHSMGGGSSFLACENNTDVTTLITFAAAVTIPSSIDAAKNITIPTLVFSGQNDCVAPADEHQIPMYDSLASDCKTFVSVLGGSHCYFGNYNFNCSFGEGTCSPSPTISRDEQNSAFYGILLPYLDFILKDNTQSENTFLDSLLNSSRISYNRTCSITSVSERENSHANQENNLEIYPNPSTGNVNFKLDEIGSWKFQILDSNGRIIIEDVINESLRVNMSKYSKGLYVCKLIGETQTVYKKLTIY